MRGHVKDCVRGHVRGRGNPKWEAVGVRGGRPCKAKVEAEVGGRSGRPKWEALRGRGRPNLGSLIGSDRSYDKMWEAEAM